MTKPVFLPRSLNLLSDALLALVYPQSCALCEGSVESRACGVVCTPCWSKARIFTQNEVTCWKCGAVATGRKALNQKREQVRCRNCDQEAFTAARACGAYQGALRASVLALKHEPNVCKRLLDLLIDTQSHSPLNQASRIIPVPLHPDREKARGFNQAAVIGRALSRSTSLPLDDVSLVRITHSERSRAGMDARGRRETVADAFSVRQPPLLESERILLVDDVYTTGATVSSCAKALMEAGAADVFVLTIARTLTC